jgi:hypothetical protein
MGSYAKISEKITISSWWFDKFMENYGVIVSHDSVAAKEDASRG